MALKLVSRAAQMLHIVVFNSLEFFKVAALDSALFPNLVSSSEWTSVGGKGQQKCDRSSNKDCLTWVTSGFVEVSAGRKWDSSSENVTSFNLWQSVRELIERACVSSHECSWCCHFIHHLFFLLLFSCDFLLAFHCDAGPNRYSCGHMTAVSFSLSCIHSHFLSVLCCGHVAQFKRVWEGKDLQGSFLKPSRKFDFEECFAYLFRLKIHWF